jgi:cytochrome c biogenesis protein CcmG/thiol:disulfide interchange protein DsbE
LIHRVAQIGAVGLVVALLGLLVVNLVRSNGGDVAREVDRGEIVLAPTFTRPRVDVDGTLSLESLRGKVVVLNFWQSYCPPCEREAPDLVLASKRWADKDVVFVGIDVQDLRGKAREFLERFEITYPNVADSGPLVGRYGVTGYPETFFIDRQGRVVPPHIVGPATQEDLDEGIRKALASA